MKASNRSQLGHRHTSVGDENNDDMRNTASPAEPTESSSGEAWRLAVDDNAKSIESLHLEDGAWRRPRQDLLENASDFQVGGKGKILSDDPVLSKDWTPEPMEDDGLLEVGSLADPSSVGSHGGKEGRSASGDDTQECVVDLRLDLQLNDRDERPSGGGRKGYLSTLRRDETSTQCEYQQRPGNMPVRTSKPSCYRVLEIPEDSNSGAESVRIGKRRERDEAIKRTLPNMCEAPSDKCHSSNNKNWSMSSSMDEKYSFNGSSTPLHVKNVSFLQHTPPAQQVTSCRKGKMPSIATAETLYPEVTTSQSLLSTAAITPWDRNTHEYHQPLPPRALEIVEYDDSWPGQFQAVKQMIMKTLITTQRMFTDPFAGQRHGGDEQASSPSLLSHALARSTSSDQMGPSYSCGLSETSSDRRENVTAKSTSSSTKSLSSRSNQSSELSLGPLDLSLVQSIHHVGSTSVPDMSGRPIIDVAVCLDSEIIHNKHYVWVSLMLGIPGMRLVSSQVRYCGYHMFAMSLDGMAGIEANIHVFLSMRPINEMLAAKYYLTMIHTPEARDWRQKLAATKQRNAQNIRRYFGVPQYSDMKKHGDQIHRTYETVMAEAHNEIAKLALRAWWIMYETDPATQNARRSILECFSDPETSCGADEYGSGDFCYDYRVKRGTEEFLVKKRRSMHPARTFEYIK